MAERTGASIRARVRAELTDEIKDVARRHLATEGANLSLRAVARELGMVSSALYRYFASRDELLTALIIDAYDALGQAAEAADAAHPDRHDHLGRWLAATRAVRRRALATPAEYALIHGSPVPGYAAPQATIGPASRTPLVLVGIVADAAAIGVLPADGPPLPDALGSELGALVDRLDVDLDAATLARVMIGWTGLFGAISFEIFGQLDNMIEARDAWFDHQMCTLATLIGLAANTGARRTRRSSLQGMVLPDDRDSGETDAADCTASEVFPR